MSIDRLNCTPGALRGMRLAVIPLLAMVVLLVAAVQSTGQTTTRTYPGWWYDYGVLSSGTANDYAAANQGQAKNIAVAAVSELDNDLAQFGGAGPTLDNLASTLLTSDTSGAANDYAAVNLGQLKNLAQPFFDRLLALGYYGPPLSTGTAMTSGTYPWVISGLTANDYAAANIGQLKYLFSFDVNFSTAGDGIPDWWLRLYGLPLTTSTTTFVPWSGDQFTYLQAYQQGVNPVNYYAAETPVLTIVSGSGQTGPAGGFVPLPLVVSVTDTNGNPLVDAPVTFSVPSDGSRLQASSTASAITSGTFLTDGNGEAQIYYQLPAEAEDDTSSVTASAGASSQTVPEYLDDSGAYYPSPFAPSDVAGSMNSDGSETITWQNNDFNDPVYVYQMVASGSWQCTGTLAAGTTSYTGSASIVGAVEIGNAYSPGGSTGSPPGGGGWSGTGGVGPGSGGPGGGGTQPSGPGGYPMLPKQYQGEVWNISPIRISGTNANGSATILCSAEYATDGTGDTTNGFALITLASGTTPSSFQVVSLPSNVNLDLNNAILSAQGTMAGIGTISPPNDDNGGGSNSNGSGTPIPSEPEALDFSQVQLMIYSDQISGVECNKLPKGLPFSDPAKKAMHEVSDYNNPMILGTQYGTYGSFAVIVNGIPQSLISKFFVGVRKANSPNILGYAQAQGGSMPTYVYFNTNSGVNAVNFNSYYEIVLGYDLNGNGVFDPDEVVYEYGNQDNAAETSDQDKQIVVETDDYADALTHLSSDRDDPFIAWKYPVADSLLRTFIDSTYIPDGAAATTFTLYSSDPELKCPVGAYWTQSGAAGMATAFFYTFSTGSPATTEVEKSKTFQNILQVEMGKLKPTVEAYFAANPNVTQYTFDLTSFTWNKVHFGDRDYFYSDVNLAFGTIPTISGHFQITVQNILGFLSLKTIYYDFTFNKIYDFYIFADKTKDWKYHLSQYGATLQSGYGTLGTAGRVFESNVNCSRTANAGFDGINFNF